MHHSFHLRTARDYMVESIPMLPGKATVAEARTFLEAHASTFATISYVYLVDRGRELVGVVSVKDLFSHRPGTLLAAISVQAVTTITESTRAEAAARIAVDHGLKALPVVDAKRRLLGVVPPDALHRILHTGRTHDAVKRSGSHSFSDSGETLLKGTALEHLARRLPWLLLGLAGGVVAALIVQQFEHALAEEVLIAAFIPLVVYLADAVGSQAEILFVRALALSPDLHESIGFLRYAKRELLVTLFQSVILGVLVAAVVWWWFMAANLVLLMFTAIAATLFVAMLVAISIPYLASKFGYDPALTSGPVATVIRDLLTLIIYFYIVTWFL